MRALFESSTKWIGHLFKIKRITAYRYHHAWLRKSCNAYFRHIGCLIDNVTLRTWYTVERSISLYAGKTVLLNILAGRKPRGIVEPGSEILYDGHHPTLHYKRCHIGYVEQKDTLLEMMSPYELLTYTAFLKLPRVTRKEDIKARVQALIDELKLNSCQHTIIGSKESQKISGGEAKRTSIGIAMIANPSVLYIDELTSGLDAYTGHEVATVVKSLCQSGITICSSLHSPSPRTFHLCDRLILLHQGRVLYLGPNGVESLSYLQQNFPFLRKIEADEGIAEYLLDVTANCSGEEASLLVENYRNSNLYEINRYIIKSRNLHDYSKNCTTNGTFESTVGHLLQIDNGADIENNSNVGTISRGSQGNGADFAGNPTWWVVWVMWRFRSLRLWSTISFIAPRVLDKSIFVILITTLWW